MFALYIFISTYSTNTFFSFSQCLYDDKTLAFNGFCDEESVPESLPVSPVLSSTPDDETVGSLTSSLFLFLDMEFLEDAFMSCMSLESNSDSAKADVSKVGSGCAGGPIDTSPTSEFLYNASFLLLLDAEGEPTAGELDVTTADFRTGLKVPSSGGPNLGFLWGQLSGCICKPGEDTSSGEENLGLSKLSTALREIWGVFNSGPLGGRGSRGVLGRGTGCKLKSRGVKGGTDSCGWKVCGGKDCG